jgi:hypothetical protein
MFVDRAETSTPRRRGRTLDSILVVGADRPRLERSQAVDGRRLSSHTWESRGAEEIIEARISSSDARRKRGGNAINRIWRDCRTDLYGKNRSTDIKRRWY